MIAQREAGGWRGTIFSVEGTGLSRCSASPEQLYKIQGAGGWVVSGDLCVYLGFVNISFCLPSPVFLLLLPMLLVSNSSACYKSVCPSLVRLTSLQPPLSKHPSAHPSIILTFSWGSADVCISSTHGVNNGL